MKRFEYFYFSIEEISSFTDKKLTDLMDQYGMGGWELVSVIEYNRALRLFFKHPV